jgi:CheY-like chemotaxis protein
MASSILRDRRVLVVEDEYLIAATLADNLRTAGTLVVGPVPSVERAIERIEAEPRLDAAVVDLNLNGIMAYDVADLLMARRIPFVFSSSREDKGVLDRYPQVRSCIKPYHFTTLKASLSDAISGVATSPDLDVVGQDTESRRSSGYVQPSGQDDRAAPISDRRRRLLALGAIAAAALLAFLGAVCMATFLAAWNCDSAYSYYGCAAR